MITLASNDENISNDDSFTKGPLFHSTIIQNLQTKRAPSFHTLQSRFIFVLATTIKLYLIKRKYKNIDKVMLCNFLFFSKNV